MSKKMKFIIGLLLVAILGLSFGSGFIMGHGKYSPPAGGLDTMQEVWSIIFSDYVDKEQLDANKLSQAAIEGILEELDDPYTSYLEAKDYELGLTSLEGEFNGVGAHVSMEDGQLKVIAPIADSPAARAGIRAGDIILEIDGTS
ncbi:S41 family peptidase, partial [Chloroflexota bacterium]